MKVKLFFSVTLLGLLIISTLSCSKDDESKNKVKKVILYISAETGTYQPWGSDKPLACMLVTEDGQTDVYKLGFSEINGFEYEMGYEYVLSVEKTILADPPADGSSYIYKLIEMLDRKCITCPPEVPVDFTEDDIEYKEGCPYSIYEVSNIELLINSEGRIIDSSGKPGPYGGWISLTYALSAGNKYYDKWDYRGITAYVIDPFMKDHSESYIRLIKVYDEKLMVNEIFTEEAVEFMKTQARVGEKMTYKIILLNYERLGLQDIEITLIKD